MTYKDTRKLGPEKILAAAAEAGLQPDAGAGVRTIRAAAAEARVQTDPCAGVRKILAAVSEAQAEDAIDPIDRIRRAAGKQSQAQEDFVKSMYALDGLGSMLHRPLPSVNRSRRWMPKPSRLAKALEGHQITPLSASQRRRPSPPVIPTSANQSRPGPPEPVTSRTPELASRRFPWADMPVPAPHEAGHRFYDFRDRLAGDIRAGALSSTPESLVSHVHLVYGLPVGAAAEWTERFLIDLGRHRERHQRQATITGSR